MCLLSTFVFDDKIALCGEMNLHNLPSKSFQTSGPLYDRKIFLCWYINLNYVQSQVINIEIVPR